MRIAIISALLVVAGCSSSTPNTPSTTPPSDGAPSVSVNEHHGSRTRNGVYVEPALTRAAAAKVHRVAGFNATLQGPVYAQPLYIEGANGGADQVIVATEQDAVISFDPQTGAQNWMKVLGQPVPHSALPCGNIDLVGITGTPVFDPATRVLYVGAMVTPDGSTVHHQVWALDVDSGQAKSGWPITVDSAISSFDATVENQRGALLLVGGRIYVPYGGHFGDCGDYHGWVVGISTTNPADVKGWETPAQGGGIWAPGGLSSDGTSVFAATGNTFGATTWGGGEAIVKLGSGPSFSGKTTDYFAPTDWQALDSGDVDIGGSGPVLLDLAASTPAHLAIALGKNGMIYVLDRDNLGGVSNAPASAKVSDDEIINAATAYTTAKGTYVAFQGSGTGCGGDLAAVKISEGKPPSLAVTWCAQQNGGGSPIFTTTGKGNDPLVWVVGAEGDNRLRAFDADTGQVVFDGGGSGDQLGTVQHFQTPIVAKGRIYVAGNDALYAFSP